MLVYVDNAYMVIVRFTLSAGLVPETDALLYYRVWAVAHSDGADRNRDRAVPQSLVKQFDVLPLCLCALRDDEHSGVFGAPRRHRSVSLVEERGEGTWGETWSASVSSQQIPLGYVGIFVSRESREGGQCRCAFHRFVGEPHLFWLKRNFAQWG